MESTSEMATARSRAAVDGPLAHPGWTVSAIAVGDFNNDNLPDIAFTETARMGSPPTSACSRTRAGANSSSARRSPCPSMPDPIAIQTIAFGNGIVDLAVADSITGNVAIFVGDGQGGFSPGPVLRRRNQTGRVWWPADSATATST